MVISKNSNNFALGIFVLQETNMHEIIQSTQTQEQRFVDHEMFSHIGFKTHDIFFTNHYI